MGLELSESFSTMVREKGVDKDHLQGIIEEIFKDLVKKKYGDNAQAEVMFNTDKGEIEIHFSREVVDVVEDASTQISIQEVEAAGNEDELEVGDEYVEKIQLSSFGRRIVNLAKQNLNTRLRELEKEIVAKEYEQLVGEIVIGDVYQMNKGNVLVNHNKNELLLPREEQIPGEKMKKGETIRAVVKEVRKGQNRPEVIISRTEKLFLAKLFEIEVPEIYDGIVEIRMIARRPGERAKIAVASQDKRIDPVGACVGMKGVRVTAIVRELNNENIDVINFSDDPKLMIQRSLAPGKLKRIEIDAQTKTATVYADADQAASIVGRNGVNINLAMELSGYHIDFIREEKKIEEIEEEEDIELFDMREELGEEVYNILIDNGYDTALQTLRAGKEKLLEIPDLDEEQVVKIIEVLQAEFEE